MAGYSNRFLADTYVEDEPVVITAFTDRNRDLTSVSMPETLFTRAIALGAAYQLNLLPTFDAHANTSLLKAQCSTLLDEVRFVRRVVNDPLLQQHLGSLVTLLEKCIQAAGASGVLIEGP